MRDTKHNTSKPAAKPTITPASATGIAQKKANSHSTTGCDLDELCNFHGFLKGWLAHLANPITDSDLAIVVLLEILWNTKTWKPDGASLRFPEGHLSKISSYFTAANEQRALEILANAQLIHLSQWRTIKGGTNMQSIELPWLG